MADSNEVTRTTEPTDFLNDTYAKLDDLDHAELYSAATEAIAKQGGITADVADRLDRIFTVKLVRLLRTPTVPTGTLRELDELIARVSRDRYQEALDALPARFYARWRALRDVISTSYQIDAFQDSLAREPIAQPASSWEVVARFVVDAGAEGVPWSAAANAVMSTKSGPRTKGGVSQMITAMRAHGWVEAIPKGRSKLLVAGKNIAKSQAWQQRYGALVTQPAESSSVAPFADASSQKLSEVARQAVSLNQGAFLDFSHLAHERHRRLRMTAESQPRPLNEKLKSDIQELAGELISFMNDRFKNVSLQNFELLKRHFDNRSDVGPRLCIKGNWRPVNWQPSRNTSVCIRPIIRDAGVDYDAVAASADNTGFDHVIDTGTYYLNNDIARAALLGRYRNPRFNYEAVEKLKRRLDMSDVASGRGLTPEDWLSCWKDSGTSDTRCFYRSTLIVPLTLRNKNLSDEFTASIKKRLQNVVPKNVSSTEGGATDYDRSILGFLCLDHPEANYFYPDVDVNTAFIFADLLSMYVFTLITLTTLSKTYRHATSAMGKSHWDALQIKVKTRLRAVQAPCLPPSLELGKTLHNMVFSLPETIDVQTDTKVDTRLVAS